MIPFTETIKEGLKLRVCFNKKPFGWTNNAIYEVEDIFGGLGWLQIKFKGYNLIHDFKELSFFNI